MTAVESGQTALSWLEAPEQRFDLVFLDANMPGISGREVLAHIQNSPRHRELGIILCTSSSDRPALGAAGELGTDHTLPKPCTAEGIAQKLRHFGAIPHAPSN